MTQRRTKLLARPKPSDSPSPTRAMHGLLAARATHLTLLVIDDDFTIGRKVRDALLPAGHFIHVRTRRTLLVDDLAYLRPDVVVLNLGANPTADRALTQTICRRRATTYLIVYADADIDAVRVAMRPDLVLVKTPILWVIQQARCWAQHL